MNVYTIVLFLHVSGTIGVFMGVGTWLFGAAVMRRAERVEQVRIIAGLTVMSGNLAVVSLLLLAAAGLYLALTVWGIWTGWIDVATVSFVLLGPVGGLVIDPRMRAIAKAAKEVPDGPLPEALEARTHDPVLGTGLRIYIVYLLGIVFVMITKPAVEASILVMAIALALGLLSGLPLWRAARVRAK